MFSQRMGIARRGTRILNLNGERYRWVVAPGDEPGLAIVVEIAEGHGQRMVTWVDHGTIITPRLVARVVHRALHRGWTPKQRATRVVYRIEGGPGMVQGDNAAGISGLHGYAGLN